MIFKRFGANLRAQNWFAIGIEIGIVIVGVFVGNQVSNWNEARIEKAETVKMMRGIEPELQNLIVNFRTITDYYRVTRDYAETAFAGWRGDPQVSDRAFVIAAYQASQNTLSFVNNASWSDIFGGDRLRTLDDQELREQLSVLMTTDFAAMEREVFSDYRENVRKVIPEDIQDTIRAQCGDQRFASGYTRLPPTCSLNLPDARFATAARDLRAHPELVGEMRWHFAAAASYVENLDNLSNIARRVINRAGKV